MAADETLATGPTVRPAPRLVNDTRRALVATGVLMVVTLVFSIGYGLVQREWGLPAAGPTYFSSLLLLTFVAYFLIYQLFTWHAFSRADPEELLSWVRATTPRSERERRLQWWTGSGSRSWAVTAASFALLAVLAVLLAPSGQTPVILGACLLAVLSSWLMLVIAYAVAYLREHAERGGLTFPDGPRLVWSDFFYLAVQVSATFSSSDVDVTSTRMRRLVTGHTLLAFLFNTVILALLVSVLLTLAE